MSQACPVSFKQVDENAARMNAVLSALSVVLFLVTSYKFILFFLAIDFFVRGFIDPLYSFYSAVSKSFLRMLKIFFAGNLINIRLILMCQFPLLYYSSLFLRRKSWISP